MAVRDPSALLRRLLKESSESSWLEFKVNNSDPEVIGQWASACANAAILAAKERAFLVFGVNNTRVPVGTNVRLAALRCGGENFTNWLSRLVEPRPMMEFLDFTHQSLNFSILAIEPTYDRPVKFRGIEYIRIGENIKKLSEFPDHERAIWLATGRRKFENAIAITHQTAEQVLDKLDADAYYRLIKEECPHAEEIMRRFALVGLIVDDLEGGYDITNLGSILFAKRLSHFSLIEHKAVRVIKYKGHDKMVSERESEGKKGYAVGFSDLMKYVSVKLPKEEAYRSGIRHVAPLYPETAIREIIANALIHQDFTISGSGPVIEIYDGRIEITNPGNSLIEIDRIIDERRSRNEKLASTMRGLGLCEERGGGLDKAIMDIEDKNLPPPEFNSSKDSMRVVLHGPRAFSKLSKTEKMRACYFHCVIRWLKSDYMSNTTLRARFRLPQEEYQAVSNIISASVKAKRIAQAEANQGKRNAKYVPYWARNLSRRPESS
jgi:ATP-dependent DNA helicase RecG